MDFTHNMIIARIAFMDWGYTYWTNALSNFKENMV